MKYDSLRNIWMLTRKNITLYVKKGPVLIFGLMFPFFMVLSWILGRDLILSQIFIGIITMTSFFTSTAVSPVILPIETREKSLERLLSAPLSLNEILFGILIASTLYSFIITSIITTIFLIFSPILITSTLSLVLIFIGISLMAILGSLLGLLISANPTDMTSDIMVIVNLVKFPLLFISGIFIPLSKVPPFVAFIYFLSPLTFLTELLRNNIDKSNLIPIELSLAILIVWILVLFTLNYLLHRKTMPKRFSETGGSLKIKMMMKKQ